MLNNYDVEILEELQEIDVSVNELKPPPYTIRELNEEVVIVLEKNKTE